MLNIVCWFIIDFDLIHYDCNTCLNEKNIFHCRNIWKFIEIFVLWIANIYSFMFTIKFILLVGLYQVCRIYNYWNWDKSYRSLNSTFTFPQTVRDCNKVNGKSYITWITYDCKFLIVKVDLSILFCAIEIICFFLVTPSCNRMNRFMVRLHLPGSKCLINMVYQQVLGCSNTVLQGYISAIWHLVLQPLLPHIGWLPLLRSVIWVVSEGWTGFYAVILSICSLMVIYYIWSTVTCVPSIGVDGYFIYLPCTTYSLAPLELTKMIKPSKVFYIRENGKSKVRYYVTSVVLSMHINLGQCFVSMWKNMVLLVYLLYVSLGKQ